jgi:hypothetical protein
MSSYGEAFTILLYTVVQSTLLLRIQDVPGLIHGPGDCVLKEVIHGFPQFLQANAGMVP